MTPEEREKILDVISTADGSCSSCANQMLTVLRANLPGEPWPEAFGYSEHGQRSRRACKVTWPEDYEADSSPSGCGASTNAGDTSTIPSKESNG